MKFVYLNGLNTLLQSSGLPALLSRATASCTYEGENTVMHLQCARYVGCNFGFCILTRAFSVWVCPLKVCFLLLK